MSELILLNSDDYFKGLVQQGCERKRINLEPYIVTYVVGLLTDYMDAQKLKETDTLAEAYLKAQLEGEPIKSILLKNLGDKALYISGFFSESLNRKVVDIDYYVNMGTSAFHLLSSARSEDHQKKLFKTVSQRFMELVEVLNYISHQTLTHSDQNIMRLYENYLLTGSEAAKEKLLEMGIISLPIDQLKLGKQG